MPVRPEREATPARGPHAGAAGGDALLEVRQLRTYIPTRRGLVKAVDGASFALRRGETLGIVGESGSGKSMTCLSIVRLVPEPGRIVDGQILFEGEDLLRKSPAEMQRIRGARIGMILQDPLASLNPAFTIGEQIAESLRVHLGLPRRSALERVVELLRQVQISDPERRAEAYPHQMSGGMRQRVAGAIAVSCRPSLLIADEPTTALDVTIQAQYLRLLKRLQRETNVGLIFVTHNLGIVARVCDRVAVMYAGQIVETGATRDLFSRPHHPYTIGLFRCLPALAGDRQPLATIEGQPPDLADLPPGCSFAPRCALAEARCREASPPLEPVSPGQLAACWRIDATAGGGASVPPAAPAGAPSRPEGPERRPSRGAGVILEAKALTRHFPVGAGLLFGRAVGKVRAVDGVDFVLRRGETLGLVGESGCGKTSTARLVLRLDRPTGGCVLFRGRDIQSLGGQALGDYRRAVQAVFQDPYSSLNPRRTVASAVSEPVRETSPGLSRAEVADLVAQSLAAVGLRPALAGTYPHELSGGQRQRVALARALATRPACIVLDEPVSALDVSIRAQVMNLLRELQDRLGASFLLIAHDLAAVKYVSTHIGVMYLGRLVETGPAEELAARPLHPYTQALLNNALPAHPDDPREEAILPGEVPSPLRPPGGCRFHPRCPHAMPACTAVDPDLRERDSGHRVACHLYDGP